MDETASEGTNPAPGATGGRVFVVQEDEWPDELIHEVLRRIEQRVYDRFDVIEVTAQRILESGDL